MPSSDDKRYRQAREKGDKFGDRAKGILAGVAAIGIGIAAFGGQVFPWIAAAFLDLLGAFGLAVSVVAVAVAGAIRRSSDEPKERMAWFLVLVALAAALLFYLGKL